jgi:hypothetical protein
MTHISNLLKSVRALLICLVLGAGSFELHASHLAGADLTYQSLGNGTYLVTYTLYRDCFGITAPTTAFLSVASTSCGQAVQNVTMTLSPGSGNEITPSCSTSTSTCNGGSAAGIEEYVYTALVQLPLGCPDWHLWVDDCCRNQSISTVQNASGEGLYIEAYLNNTVVQNSSPTFNNVPIVFFCIGQTNYFNHGAVDADGDSLVYYFIAPRNSENDPVTYNTGYSVSNPLSSSPGVTINATTGDIAVNPTQQEIGIMSVLVEEYRNGVLIGRVMRDIQVYTVACSNTLPSLSGVNGSTTYNTSACIGGAPLCFNINSNDNNSGDSLWLSWNNGIPGATFNPGTGPRPVGQFCWSPTPADARPNPYTFTVTVHDNSCPSPGVQTYSFSVIVSALNVTVTSTPSVRCFGESSGSASASATGTGPFQYLWMPGQYTTASVSSLPAGTYTVDIIDGTGCTGTRTFTITEPPALTLNLSGTASQCSGGPGSAIATVGGGTPSYTYSWNTNPVQTTATASNLSPGNYTVTVLDANQCRIRGSVAVSGSNPVLASLSVTDASCAALDGAIDVTVTSGTAPYTFDWDPNVSTSSSATGLTTGIYNVTVTDALGCSTTLTGTVNSSGISATVSAISPASCSTSEDGSATVVASGGLAPYSYLWMPTGDTTATVNTLAPDSYSILVTDYLGCATYAFVTIGSTYPGPTVNLGPDSVACVGSTVLLDAGAGAGQTYLWSDNSTNQTLSVSSNGVYTVLVTDVNGCQNFDAVTVNFISCIGNPQTQTLSGTGNSSVSIFPNPTHDNIEVTIAKVKDQDVEITVNDILGHEVFRSKEFAEYNYSRVIDMKHLPAGIYLVKVSYGKESRSIRLVNE